MSVFSSISTPSWSVHTTRRVHWPLRSVAPVVGAPVVVCTVDTVDAVFGGRTAADLVADTPGGREGDNFVLNVGRASRNRVITSVQTATPGTATNIAATHRPTTRFRRCCQRLR
jgi:hypothetical protein